MKSNVHKSIKNELAEQQMIDTITQIRHTPHVWQVGNLIDHHKEGASLTN